MSALSSYISNMQGVLGMAYAGWLPFTSMHVKPVDLTGRTALVSGANVGIGYECALKLAQFGAHVWILCRDPAKAEAARLELVKASGNDQITVGIVDFGSLSSIRQFVKQWDSQRPIDIIINNAGLVSSRFLKTPDGYEITYQTNFLSHFMLNLGLLPYLADHARIVNVSSHGQYAATEEFMDPSDMDSDIPLGKTRGFHDGDEIPWSLSQALYNKTKLFQIIYGRQLQQRLAASPAYAKKGIVLHGCHPGFVASSIWGRSTTMASSAAKLQAFLIRLVNTLGTSCEQGACTPVYLATAPETAIHGGGYWDRMSKRTPHVLALNDALGDTLWEVWVRDGELEELTEGLQNRQ